MGTVPSARYSRAMNHAHSLMGLGSAAAAAGDFTTAERLFLQAATLQHPDAFTWLGAYRLNNGDSAEAASLLERGGALGSADACHLRGLIAIGAGDLQAGLVWMEKAHALGHADTVGHRMKLLSAAGAPTSSERTTADSLTATRKPPTRWRSSRSATGVPARRSCSTTTDSSPSLASCRTGPWAQISDLHSLSDEAFSTYLAEAKAWAAPYQQIAGVIRDRGHEALVDPLSDRERALVALARVQPWLDESVRRARAAEAGSLRLKTDRALAALAQVKANTTLASPSGGRRDLRWMGEPAGVGGCRLLSDLGAPRTVRGCWSFDSDAIMFVAAGHQRVLPWERVEDVSVQTLDDRSRVTVPRAAGLGLLSLAAKKRVGWCALTVIWEGRHVVFEVPVEAHQLKAMFATASVPVS